MKVLILTVSTGEGHNSAARAIHEEIERRGEECYTLDVCYNAGKLLGDTVSGGYRLAIDALSVSYSSVYKKLEKRKKNARSPVVRIFSILGPRLYGFISEYSPDIIICTHVFAALAIKRLKLGKASKPYILGIVTDFTVHPYWEEVNEKLDFLVIPSEKLDYQCLKKGFRKEQLLPFGIPLRKEIRQKLGREEAKNELGLYPDRPVITVMSGSMGYGSISKTVKKLDTLKKCFQIIAICGSSEEAYSVLCESKLFHRALIFGYTDKVSIILDASDCLVTKPGGLSVSEALAKGVPMILTDPIPGHEERNEAFIMNTGAAVCASGGITAEEAVRQLLSDKKQLKRMSVYAASNGKADSSVLLADFIENLNISKNR